MSVSKSAFEIDDATLKKAPDYDTSLRQQHTSWITPLCISHAAAAWGERSWEFGSGLLLLQLNGSNESSRLRLTAILVLAECTVCSLIGPRIGRAVDRSSFLASAIVTLAVQSIAIACAAGFLIWAFDGREDNMKWLGGGAIACSVIARLASLGSTVSVEKKWATALSHYTQHCYGRLVSREQVSKGESSVAEEESELEGESDRDESNNETVSDEAVEAIEAIVQQDSQVLSKVNARLRCIDLTCNLCAPIAVGFLLESTNPSTAAMFIAVFNVLAWPVEVACLVWIHRRYRDVLSSDESLSAEMEVEDDDESSSVFAAWKLYLNQTIFRSALALAVLYLSVVSFGTIMTAWFAATGFHMGHLGAARALAALSGMLSTVTTPRLVENAGLESAATKYIWFMWAFILTCTLAAFNVSEYPRFLWIIVTSVIVSRFGLWGFDLCVTQLLQERIEPPEKIGEINATQVALQNAFDALAALSCVLLPNPDTFVYLILGSFGSVTIAALLQTSLWRSYAC